MEFLVTHVETIFRTVGLLVAGYSIAWIVFDVRQHRKAQRAYEWALRAGASERVARDIYHEVRQNKAERHWRNV